MAVPESVIVAVFTGRTDEDVVKPVSIDVSGSRYRCSKISAATVSDFEAICSVECVQVEDWCEAFGLSEDDVNAAPVQEVPADLVVLEIATNEQVVEPVSVNIPGRRKLRSESRPKAPILNPLVPSRLSRSISGANPPDVPNTTAAFAI